MNILFVCTSNVIRSPMAEAVLRELAGAHGRHTARSAGTAAGAVQRLTTRKVAWADVVAVMEAGHLALIRRDWPDHARKVRVLGVPDDYDPGAAELRAVLTAKVRALLDELASRDGVGKAPRGAPGDPESPRAFRTR